MIMRASEGMYYVAFGVSQPMQDALDLGSSTCVDMLDSDNDFACLHRFVHFNPDSRIDMYLPSRPFEGCCTVDC